MFLETALREMATAATKAIPVLARAATDAVDQVRAANVLRLLELEGRTDVRSPAPEDVDEVRAALGMQRSLR